MKRAVTSDGCRYGHGPERMHENPDGLWVCRTCRNYSIVLRNARKTLPDLPGLHEFVALHGFDAIDRLRRAMRKPPSQAKGPDGKYHYARPLRFRSLDEQLSYRRAVKIDGAEALR